MVAMFSKNVWKNSKVAWAIKYLIVLHYFKILYIRFHSTANYTNVVITLQKVYSPTSALTYSTQPMSTFSSVKTIAADLENKILRNSDSTALLVWTLAPFIFKEPILMSSCI